MSGNNELRGELIKEGVTIVASNNAKVRINHLISDSGGQGDVYHVTFRNHDYAMKWYCKNPNDVIGGAQYSTISEICGEEKKPSDKFIWPLFIVTEENPAKGKRFGYLMELIPEGYYEMEHFLRMDGDPKAVRFNSYNSMLVAGMNIPAAMQKLHLKGLTYKDLNPKNFAINPNNGDVLVVDNDNVSVDGSKSSVRGTPGYMAPEIPRSKYRVNPSRQTDYYSLAIILYRLFFVDHPMEGAAWDKYPLCTEKVEDYLYAIKPVFHFHPQDESNRPTSVYAPNATVRWKTMPQELRKMFIHSFTEGIEQPSKRLPENAWINAIAKTRDKLIRITPQREQFVNFLDSKSIPPYCLRMEIGSNQIALYPKKAVYEISVDGNTHQYSKVVAGILYNSEAKRLMIRNMTNSNWRARSPETKQIEEIKPGQEYPLCPGTAIEFQHESPQIVGKIYNAC